MTASVPWRLSSDGAMLRAGSLECRVDPTHLSSGIQDILYQGHRLESHRLLSLKIPGLEGTVTGPTVAESYTRGEDFIVTYQAFSPLQFHPQVYWQYRQKSAACGIETMISMQTDVLESRPVVEVTAVHPGEVWHYDESQDAFEPFAGASSDVYSADEVTPVFLTRENGRPYSLLEMAYPTDAHELLLESVGTDEVAVTFRLMHENLERGVIRRLRVATWFLPREDDLQIAAELFRDLLQAEPPLTT